MMNQIKERMLLTLALSTLCLFVADTARSQGSGRKEGKYFIELGEVLVYTEDMEMPFFRTVDPLSSTVKLDPGSSFIGDPFVTFGVNFLNGKTTISVSAWQVNKNRDNQTFFDDGTIVQGFMKIPDLFFSRRIVVVPPGGGSDGRELIVPNTIGEAEGKSRFDLKYMSVNYAHNIKETEKWRLRWSTGFKVLQFENEYQGAYFYEDEYWTYDNQLYDFNDYAVTTIRVKNQGFGPYGGLRLRWLPKDWFCLKGSLDVTVLKEASNMNYRSLNIDSSVSPSNGVDLRYPRGIIGSNEVITTANDIAYIEFDNDDFSDLVPVTEMNLAGEFRISDYFSVRVGYYNLRWFDYLSARGMVDQINRTIDNIRFIPGNASSPYVEERVGRFEADVGPLEVRKDIVLNGCTIDLIFTF